MSLHSHHIFLMNVRRRLRELGLCQREFARRLGVSDAQVSRLLNAKFVPTLTAVDKIAEALGCTSLYLFTPVDAPETEKILRKWA